MQLPAEPFVVAFLERMFRWVNTYASPFEFILRRRFEPGVRADKGTVAALTECWILLNFSLALVAVLLVPTLIEWAVLPSWGRVVAESIFFLYPAVRIAEIVVFQIWTQILGGYRGKPPRMVYTVLGLRRSVVLAGLLYVEVIVWFGVIYRVLAEHFSKDTVRHWYGALYYSAVTMTTTGFGDITPTTAVAHVVVTSQILVGWAMIVLIVSRVVAYLPRPRSLDPADDAEQSPDSGTRVSGPASPAGSRDLGRRIE